MFCVSYLCTYFEISSVILILIRPFSYSGVVQVLSLHARVAKISKGYNCNGLAIYIM